MDKLRSVMAQILLDHQAQAAKMINSVAAGIKATIPDAKVSDMIISADNNGEKYSLNISHQSYGPEQPQAYNDVKSVTKLKIIGMIEKNG